jgi:hypothetical protein
VARQRSAKPSTAVRIRSRPQDLFEFKNLKGKTMAVTRLKRKDRKNKTTSRLEVKRLKLATNIELGSRSQQSTTNQLAKNNAILAQLVAANG